MAAPAADAPPGLEDGVLGRENERAGTEGGPATPDASSEAPTPTRTARKEPTGGPFEAPGAAGEVIDATVALVSVAVAAQTAQTPAREGAQGLVAGAKRGSEREEISPRRRTRATGATGPNDAAQASVWVIIIRPR